MPPDTRPVAERLLGSRKVWVAIAAVVTSIGAMTGLPEATAKTLVAAIGALGVAVIGAIGYEDGKRNEADQQTSTTIKPPSVNGWLVVLIPTLLLLLATGGCATPGGPYVAADRATYNAVAPEYRDYVNADPALTPDQQARRERTVATWRMRLEAAEATTRPSP